MWPFNNRESASVQAPTASGTNWLSELIAAGTDKSSMNVAAVWRCVNLISDSIAIMPLRYKRIDAQTGIYKSFNKNDQDRLFYLLNIHPNSHMNGFMMKKNLVMRMLLRGNAFVVPMDDAGNAVNFLTSTVSRLVLLSEDPVYDKYQNKYTICDQVQGVRRQTVPASCIWHFKNPGTDGGFWGESTVNHAAKSLNMLATADQLALKTVSTGGRIKAILSGIGGSQTIGTASRKQMEGAALDVESNLASHDIVTLPDKNLELKPLSMSASEMDFVNNRKFGVSDVCRWFGVPEYKLGMNTSNYKSVDAAQADFYSEALLPICTQIETELLNKTTDAETWIKYKFDFDERPLFQLDMGARAKWMKAKMEMGIVSINEMRAEMDIPPVEGGDTLLMSANLKSLGALINENQPQMNYGSN